MATLAIRMSLVDRKSNIIFIRFEGTVTTETTAAGPGRYEWITTLSAEEMLFVIGPFAKVWVI